jgi:hypothetical protein
MVHKLFYKKLLVLVTFCILIGHNISSTHISVVSAYSFGKLYNTGLQICL